MKESEIEILKLKTSTHAMIQESLKLFALGARLSRPAQVTFMRSSFPAASFITKGSAGNTKVLDEKEKGDEQIYFKRQEGKYLINSHACYSLKNADANLIVIGCRGEYQGDSEQDEGSGEATHRGSPD